MSKPNFTDELDKLESIEDFLSYFCIAYDLKTVQVNRLHILQRFHNYIENTNEPKSYETWRNLLLRAYEDFVRSDSLTEGVFAVFKRAKGIQTVSVGAIQRKTKQ